MNVWLPPLLAAPFAGSATSPLVHRLPPRKDVAFARLGWVLLALAWIDTDHSIPPDALTLPLVDAGLVVIWTLTRSDITGHVLGAIIGYMLLWLIDADYQQRRGRQGSGHSDAKLMAAGGAWAGFLTLPAIMRIAALMLWLGRNDPLPFGPWMALGNPAEMVW